MKISLKSFIFYLPVYLVFFSISLYAQTPKKITAKGLTGILYRYENFPSEFIPDRNVDVWLPSDYFTEDKKNYRVIYMHDGQNLFIPFLSQSGIEWEIDETLSRLMNENRIDRTIVVAIWNTPRRTVEFMPQRAFEIKNERETDRTGESDKYLKYLVSEIKPFIDKNYRTKKDRKDTFVMGSSMGGLMSLYAIGEYPEIFGGAASLSTHYPLAEGVFLEYLKKRLPSPEKHKIYYSYGTEGSDADYESYQKTADKIMKENNFKFGINWITKKFLGGDHTEKSWRNQVEAPFLFLLRN